MHLQEFEPMCGDRWDILFLLLQQLIEKKLLIILFLLLFSCFIILHAVQTHCGFFENLLCSDGGCKSTAHKLNCFEKRPVKVMHEVFTCNGC